MSFRHNKTSSPQVLPWLASFLALGGKKQDYWSMQRFQENVDKGFLANHFAHAPNHSLPCIKLAEVINKLAWKSCSHSDGPNGHLIQWSVARQDHSPTNVQLSLLSPEQFLPVDKSTVFSLILSALDQSQSKGIWFEKKFMSE